MANSSATKNQGFTLLEVIIALAIMVLAFASILAVESGSISASFRAKQMNIVGMLAKNQMVETEFKIEGKAFDEIQKEEQGTFDPPYQDYRWKTEVKEIQFPNLTPPKSAASGSTGGGEQDNDEMSNMVTKIITSYLSKAIREVTVTVFWKRGTQEQSFSLSTYWVNLNHEFNPSE